MQKHHPINLKGGTYSYRGQVYTVKDCYVVDGQFAIKTDSKEIRIDRSAMKEEFKNFKPVNGKTIPKNRTANVLGEKKGIDPVRTFGQIALSV